MQTSGKGVLTSEQ